MVWKFVGHLPVYQQIMERIEGAVLSGEYQPGQKIPSVRDLAVEAKVNPNTMQHALQELEQMKLLVTVGTSGRYVTEDSVVLEAFRAQKLTDLTAECIGRYSALGVTALEAAELFRKYDAERIG